MKIYSQSVILSLVALLAVLLASCTVTVSPLGSGARRQGPPPQVRGSSGGSQMMGRPQGGSSCQTMGRPSSGGQQRQAKLCQRCHKPLLPINGQRPTVCQNCGLDLRKAFAGSSGGSSSGSCGSSSARSYGSSSGSCGSSSGSSYRPLVAASFSSSSGSSSTRSQARQEVYDYRTGVASEIKDFRQSHAGDPPTKSEVHDFRSGLRSDGKNFRSDMRSQYGSGPLASSGRPPLPRRLRH